MLKLTTDKHEVSRSLSATAELLVFDVCDGKFTATLVHILCSGIYGHFTTFYMAFAAAFTATLVCIFTIYRHFSQFYSFSAAVLPPH